jgi:hypothetical protein
MSSHGPFLLPRLIKRLQPCSMFLVYKLFFVILILCVCVCVCWKGGTAVVLGRIYCLVFVNYITVLFDMCSNSVRI